MFRRSTKITSLIVAAASVATMVPAMAADYKKVEDNDGAISYAVAYKDGKFYIDGEPEEKDEDAYYFSNGKYEKLDDVDSGDTVTDYQLGDNSIADTYLGKYIEIEDGDYYLDLSTGKVTDDDIVEDALDDASTALKKKVKKDNPDGRYVSSQYDDNLPNVGFVPGNKFSDEYYYFNFNAADKAGRTYQVFTDDKGSYVDADFKLGKVKLNNDTAKDTDYNDNGFNLSIKGDKIIGQDKDSVYRIATLNFGTTTGEEVTLRDDSEVKKDNKIVATTAESVQVIQKISKAQDSDDHDDAKLPKTVNTYFLMEEEGKDNKAVLAEDLSSYNFVINGGKIVAYKYDGDKLVAKTITLKSTHGYYYTDFSDGIDEDEVDAVDTDVDGNVWFLQDGYAKKYDLDDDSDKVYKVDGSCDKLSVYDKDNMITWNEDDEVYSIVAGKATDDNTDDNTVTTTGWVQDATTGAWSYVKADGTKAIGWFQSPTSQLWYYMDANGVMQANGWIQDGGSWYFLDSTGAMKTGWVYTGGAWYFLKPTNGNKGAMQTGWIQTGGKWYYCNASGAMLSNTTVGGYVLGADGAWIK